MFVYPPWISALVRGFFVPGILGGANYHKAWRRDVPLGFKLHSTRLVENYHKAWRLSHTFGRPRDPNL